MKSPTKARVLEIAATRELFVSKYSYSAEKVRKMTRRMCRDGELIMVASDNRGFYYRTPK